MRLCLRVACFEIGWCLCTRYITLFLSLIFQGWHLSVVFFEFFRQIIFFYSAKYFFIRHSLHYYIGKVFFFGILRLIGLCIVCGKEWHIKLNTAVTSSPNLREDCRRHFKFCKCFLIYFRCFCLHFHRLLIVVC